MTTRTATEVKAELERKGIAVAAWAAANGFSPFTVYMLLDGKAKGSRGEGHRAAVLLGLKEGEIVQPDQVKDALSLPVQSRAA